MKKLCMIFVVIILFIITGCGDKDIINKNKSHADSNVGRYCEKVVVIYLECYMKGNIPVDVIKRQEYINELCRYVDESSSSKEGVESDKLFKDEVLDNVYIDRHDAIKGRVGNDNMQKKINLFKLQDDAYKKFKYEITSKENKDEVVVTVKFYPIDREKAQETFEKAILNASKNKLGSLYEKDMGYQQIKAKIFEQKDNEIKKIKELVSARTDDMSQKNNNTSLDLQDLMNNRNIMYDNFIGIQDDAVVETFERLELSNIPVEYSIHFIKVYKDSSKKEYIGIRCEDKEFWRDLDVLYWCDGEYNNTLLPVIVDYSYFGGS